MTITYTTAKKLKEFLGKESPIPVCKEFWKKKKDALPSRILLCSGKCCDYVRKLPYAYQLHDLLTDKFCMAMDLKIKGKTARDIANMIFVAYWDGGMEAVERALVEMMGK